MNAFKPLCHFSTLLWSTIAFLFVLFFVSCEEDVKKDNDHLYFSAININDSVTITDIGTDMELIGFFGNEKVKLPMPYNTIGEVRVGKYHSTYLTFLESGKNITINTFQDSSLTTTRVVDSLLNYLSINSLDFINENLNFIFTTTNLDSIVQIFDTYKLEREGLILSYSNRLSTSEIEILKFYNNTRLYGFLQFYGLVPQKVDAQNSFYDFTERINLSDKGLKSAPYLYLNKLKIQYLRAFGSVNSLLEFLDYIDDNVASRDISDFMKFVFIKELIESSQYWEPEQKLFNTDTLQIMIDLESENKYYPFIKKYSTKFFLTQKGKKAFDFAGETPEGSIFRLGDLNGKVVFIDVWATWCAPCIEARPKVIDIAKKFQSDPNLVVLMVSVDDSKEKWQNFLNTNFEPSISNVFIESGIKKSFGKQFNINLIPNYILIDKQGLIVNAYIKEPSAKVEEMITKELSK